MRNRVNGALTNMLSFDELVLNCGTDDRSDLAIKSLPSRRVMNEEKKECFFFLYISLHLLFILTFSIELMLLLIYQISPSMQGRESFVFMDDAIFNLMPFELFPFPPQWKIDYKGKTRIALKYLLKTKSAHTHKKRKHSDH